MRTDKRTQRPEPNRTAKSNHRRFEITEIAANLFRDHGYGATTVQDIADACGMTKVMVYYYFKSKDDILYEIYRYSMKVMHDRLDAILQTELSPSEKLGRVITSHIQTVVEYAAFIVVFFRDYRELPKRRYRDIIIQQKEYSQKIETIYAAGANDGKLRSLDPKMAAFGILGMCNWLAHWYKPNGRLDLACITDQMMTLVRDGYVLTEADAARLVAAGQPAPL